MPRKKGAGTLGANPLDVYLGEPAVAGKEAASAPRKRPITARIPEELWERFHGYYQRQPRSTTKDALMAQALEAFLDAKGA